MLLYRGALVYAEDRNHDDRHGLSPIEAEVVKYVVFGGRPDISVEEYQSGAAKLPTEVHDTLTVTPHVNHGRWVVACPWCFSQQAASRDDHRFFCVECRNAGAGGKWVRVEWHESSAEIEGLLVMRPDPRTRSWFHHETLTDLLAEHEEHGVI